MSRLEIIRPVKTSRWQRMTNAVLRSISLGPYNTKDKALAALFGGSGVSSGVAVNERTAMNYSAVWAAVNLIASDIGKVPLVLYKVDDKGGKTKFKSHPLYKLIHDRPNPQMGSMVFRKTLQAHALVWGNGYAEIERDSAGRPVALWPLLPMMVEPLIEGGRLRYRVHNPTTPPVMIEAADMLHIRGLSDDGICGYSVIGHARESIGLGIAAERFGSTFFGNGATFGGIVSYPAGITLTPESKADNRKAIEARHQGVDRAHRLLALYEGAEYHQLGVPPNAAQFLETREFQLEEVCRWFNLPPHKLKHLKRSTNNNIEHQGIEYNVDTLDPWWVAWEQEMTMKLVAPLERSQQLVEHVREGLLRGDQASRGEFYSKLFSIAAITPNEIRQRENLNPIEGGDTVYVPLNTVPLDRLDEYIDAQLKAKETPTPPPQPKQEPDPEADERMKRLESELADARRKAQEWEDRHDQRAAELATIAETLKSVSEGRDGLQGKAEQLAERAHALDLSLDQAKRELAAAVAECESIRVQMEGVKVDLTRVSVERDEQIDGRRADAEQHARAVEVYAATNDQLSQENGRLDARARDAEAERDTAKAEVVTVTAERDEQIAGRKADTDWLQSVVADLEEREKTAKASIGELSDTLKATEQERDDQVDGRKSDAEAFAAERAARIEVEVSLTDRVAAQVARNVELKTERDSLSAESETLKSELARARADIATELDRQKTQRAVMLSAMRSLFVDASERLLQREIDRARKNQGTPDKLRTWMENFYGTHAETCRQAFRPLVGPWTAIAGGAPNVLLDRLVAEHVEASTLALRQVLDADDPDAMAAALERTIRRWETERAEGMADTLVREGMGQ
jgi:HK97 family phage portal protein